MANLTERKVIIIDWIRRDTIFYEIECRIKKGVYQLKDYPSRTYLYFEDSEDDFLQGKLTMIHPDEVSIQLLPNG